ncbi:MAG: c-type cytochrome [Gemmatimonas sp.]|nr:c-type cytochrome [Gemmatimonas sp.]
MAINRRRLIGVFALAVAPILAGCPGDFGGGYEKVAYRERTPLTMVAAPDPPPFVPGLGAAAAEAPVLDPASAPPGVSQEMVEEGQQLFGTVCTACHGPGGAGSPAGPVLADAAWINIAGDYDSIVSLIQSGVPNPTEFPGAMPPMGGGSFSPEEVRSLAAYVYALSLASGA